MESVIVSIKPEWVEKIASGEKTIEVRKTAPKETPFKCYIYCSKYNANEIVLLKNYKNRFIFGDYRNADGHFYTIANGKVIGEFICDEVEEFHEWELSPQGKFADFEKERLENFLTAACLSEEEVVRYRENLPYCKPLYGWHISDLKIYDKPKELNEFYRPCPIENKDCENCIKYGKPYTWDFDEEIEKIFCTRRVTRPPQSYMFVEEVQNDSI